MVTVRVAGGDLLSGVQSRDVGELSIRWRSGVSVGPCASCMGKETAGPGRTRVEATWSKRLGKSLRG